MQPSLPIDSFNVHRLLITSVMVAAKFMDDMYYNNAYYAKVGGISTAEMNFLEVHFLFGLSFHLNVTPTTFHTYCSYLQREMLFQPTLNLVESSRNIVGRSQKIQLCYNEGEEASSHQQEELVV
ncbi:cyclin-U4-1-like [Actinidia eriantha]|uniref:cyclin-U4-1-like n=1 Tax=Actinidia eriantha TaxID=165200 RepID=UPI00258BB939|nr:cyclin-U4-1-like [Actinidia eriantha]